MPDDSTERKLAAIVFTDVCLQMNVAGPGAFGVLNQVLQDCRRGNWFLVYAAQSDSLAGKTG